MPFPEDGGEEENSEAAVYDHQPTFDPYEPPAPPPEAVQPTSPGPDPSSTAPEHGDTSGADGKQEPNPAPPQDEEQDKKEPLPEFDQRYREPFEGLLYLGRVQETFRLWDHTFVVRTLTTEDLAEIALIVQPYEGTAARNAVWQSAFVAAAVVTVDGKPLPSGITVDDSRDLTTVKFPYVMRSWLPAVREEIFNRAYELEVKVRDVLDAMGEASG